MTENLKNSLKVILKCFKEDKMSEEEILTLIETLMEDKNCGSNIITYPINVPSWPNWWDNIRYRLEPYCTTSTGTTLNDSKTNLNEGNGTNITIS